jgi:hypothetical protein
MDLRNAVIMIGVAVAAVHHRAKTLAADFQAGCAELAIAHG